MIDKLNIEKFYDYFDGVANLLYSNYKLSYLEGMNEAFSFLLDEEFEGEYSTKDIALINELKFKIIDLSFEKEEIRKSVQLGLLKGYKHIFASNAYLTPDTIGIFIGYLVEKLYKENELNSILDPLIGTGNLVFTILNHLKKKTKIYGIENNLLKCKIARNVADLLEFDNQVFYQDTLTYYDQGFDLIVADLPLSEDANDYFPYKVINHHLDSLGDSKYLFAIIENDFFEKPGNKIFKQEIDKKAYIFGLIKLNESLFKNNPKSILIIRKFGENVEKPKDFLMVDLPSFNDIDNFNRAVAQIDLWIEKRGKMI
ncbi:MAG: N-6 DNA methylase [Candidatus Izimaplasma sp.]|nr:N-6 DNA methylase [Candidatus Izimaplasma bacterium]